MRIHQPVTIHDDGSTTIDCMLCSIPVSLMNVSEIEIKVGNIRLDDMVPECRYNPVTEKVIVIEHSRSRYIPKLKRGLVCGSCLLPHHKVIMERSKASDHKMWKGEFK